MSLFIHIQLVIAIVRTVSVSDRAVNIDGGAWNQSSRTAYYERYNIDHAQLSEL